jgi:galactokinase
VSQFGLLALTADGWELRSHSQLARPVAGMAICVMNTKKAASLATGSGFSLRKDQQLQAYCFLRVELKKRTLPPIAEENGGERGIRTLGGTFDPTLA